MRPAAERNIREGKILFAAGDRYLDEAVEGPMHLKDPEAARIVEDSILFGAGERYDLFAWSVMSNHVHVLLTPRTRASVEAKLDQSQAGKPDLRGSQAGKPDLLGSQAGKPDVLGSQAGKPDVLGSQAGKPDVRDWDVPSIMKGIKGYTARRINDLQGARGRVFWRDESYDHWARDEAEIIRIVHYIEENPVKARLASQAANWPRSSARFRTNWKPGEAYRSNAESQA